MEFGMSRRIKPKEKYVRISMKEIWRNLDGPPKNKELWSYVVSFEFSRPKVAQIGRKEIFYLTNLQRTQHILFTVICRQAYGKGPLR